MGGVAVHENQSDIAALQAGLKARKPARDGEDGGRVAGLHGTARERLRYRQVTSTSSVRKRWSIRVSATVCR